MAAESIVEVLRPLADLFVSSRRILVFTGAGVSVEAGIPSYREPGGMYSSLGLDALTINAYLESRDLRARLWAWHLDTVGRHFEPSPTHLALAELEQMEILDCIVTTNHDGLHQKAGSSRVLEVHGHAREAHCLQCKDRHPIETVLARVREGDLDPRCRQCEGILKPSFVMRGETVPEQILSEAFVRASECDLCLVVGASMIVYPATDVPLTVMRMGNPLVIVSLGKTPFEQIATIAIQSTADCVIPPLVKMVQALMGYRLEGSESKQGQTDEEA